MWKSFMRDCAFYYDSPTLSDENKMRSTLQKRYDGILTPGWRAPLQSRRDLLHWGCNQLNSSFATKGFEESDLLNCENHNQLLAMFGPDYSKLREKLGYIRGLFD